MTDNVTELSANVKSCDVAAGEKYTTSHTDTVNDSKSVMPESTPGRLGVARFDNVRSSVLTVKAVKEGRVEEKREGHFGEGEGHFEKREGHLEEKEEGHLEAGPVVISANASRKVFGVKPGRFSAT